MEQGLSRREQLRLWQERKKGGSKSAAPEFLTAASNSKATHPVAASSRPHKEPATLSQSPRRRATLTQRNKENVDAFGTHASHAPLHHQGNKGMLGGARRRTLGTGGTTGGALAASASSSAQVYRAGVTREALRENGYNQCLGSGPNSLHNSAVFDDQAAGEQQALGGLAARNFAPPDRDRVVEQPPASTASLPAASAARPPVPGEVVSLRSRSREDDDRFALPHQAAAFGSDAAGSRSSELTAQMNASAPAAQSSTFYTHPGAASSSSRPARVPVVGASASNPLLSMSMSSDRPSRPMSHRTAAASFAKSGAGSSSSSSAKAVARAQEHTSAPSAHERNERRTIPPARTDSGTTSTSSSSFRMKRSASSGRLGGAGGGGRTAVVGASLSSSSSFSAKPPASARGTAGGASASRSRPRQNCGGGAQPDVAASRSQSTGTPASRAQAGKREAARSSRAGAAAGSSSRANLFETTKNGRANKAAEAGSSFGEGGRPPSGSAAPSSRAPEENVSSAASAPATANASTAAAALLGGASGRGSALSPAGNGNSDGALVPPPGASREHHELQQSREKRVSQLPSPGKPPPSPGERERGRAADLDDLPRFGLPSPGLGALPLQGSSSPALPAGSSPALQGRSSPALADRDQQLVGTYSGPRKSAGEQGGNNRDSVASVATFGGGSGGRASSRVVGGIKSDPLVEAPAGAGAEEIRSDRLSDAGGEDLIKGGASSGEELIAGKTGRDRRSSGPGSSERDHAPSAGEPEAANDSCSHLRMDEDGRSGSKHSSVLGHRIDFDASRDGELKEELVLGSADVFFIPLDCVCSPAVLEETQSEGGCRAPSGTPLGNFRRKLKRRPQVWTETILYAVSEELEELISFPGTADADAEFPVGRVGPSPTSAVSSDPRARHPSSSSAGAETFRGRSAVPTTVFPGPSTATLTEQASAPKSAPHATAVTTTSADPQVAPTRACADSHATPEDRAAAARRSTEPQQPADGPTAAPGARKSSELGKKAETPTSGGKNYPKWYKRTPSGQGTPRSCTPPASARAQKQTSAADAPAVDSIPPSQQQQQATATAAPAGQQQGGSVSGFSSSSSASSGSKDGGNASSSSSKQADAARHSSGGQESGASLFDSVQKPFVDAVSDSKLFSSSSSGASSGSEQMADVKTQLFGVKSRTGAGAGGSRGTVAEDEKERALMESLHEKLQKRMATNATAAGTGGQAAPGAAAASATGGIAIAAATGRGSQHPTTRESQDRTAEKEAPGSRSGSAKRERSASFEAARRRFEHAKGEGDPVDRIGRRGELRTAPSSLSQHGEIVDRTGKTNLVDQSQSFIAQSPPNGRRREGGGGASVSRAAGGKADQEGVQNTAAGKMSSTGTSAASSMQPRGLHADGSPGASCANAGGAPPTSSTATDTSRVARAFALKNRARELFERSAADSKNKTTADNIKQPAGAAGGENASAASTSVKDDSAASKAGDSSGSRGSSTGSSSSSSAIFGSSRFQRAGSASGSSKPPASGLFSSTGANGASDAEASKGAAAAAGPNAKPASKTSEWSSKLNDTRSLVAEAKVRLSSTTAAAPPGRSAGATSSAAAEEPTSAANTSFSTAPAQQKPASASTSIFGAARSADCRSGSSGAQRLAVPNKSTGTSSASGLFGSSSAARNNGSPRRKAREEEKTDPLALSASTRHILEEMNHRKPQRPHLETVFTPEFEDFSPDLPEDEPPPDGLLLHAGGQQQDGAVDSNQRKCSAPGPGATTAGGVAAGSIASAATRGLALKSPSPLKLDGETDLTGILFQGESTIFNDLDRERWGHAGKDEDDSAPLGGPPGVALFARAGGEVAAAAEKSSPDGPRAPVANPNNKTPGKADKSGLLYKTPHSEARSPRGGEQKHGGKFVLGEDGHGPGGADEIFGDGNRKALTAFHQVPVPMSGSSSMSLSSAKGGEHNRSSPKNRPEQQSSQSQEDASSSSQQRAARPKPPPIRLSAGGGGSPKRQSLDDLVSARSPRGNTRTKLVSPFVDGLKGKSLNAVRTPIASRSPFMKAEDVMPQARRTHSPLRADFMSDEKSPAPRGRPSVRGNPSPLQMMGNRRKMNSISPIRMNPISPTNAANGGAPAAANISPRSQRGLHTLAGGLVSHTLASGPSSGSTLGLPSDNVLSHNNTTHLTSSSRPPLSPLSNWSGSPELEGGSKTAAKPMLPDNSCVQNFVDEFREEVLNHPGHPLDEAWIQQEKHVDSEQILCQCADIEHFYFFDRRDIITKLLDFVPCDLPPIPEEEEFVEPVHGGEAEILPEEELFGSGLRDDPHGYQYREPHRDHSGPGQYHAPPTAQRYEPASGAPPRGGGCAQQPTTHQGQHHRAHHGAARGTTGRGGGRVR
eukprot:CAMPEP_0178985118 /NCGR_PEP_ID=MMETSP0795-20121207/1979_1 /TAXON_ID=88552 /ORGANISM="Amoebophrya sp., Strain Ameob2" /LENGTH=2365 /DNA_ID=CAMNT_0020676049 /DNA_START=75 /DNA_END=7172 /DNA_ORIENTATION=+